MTTQTSETAPGIQLMYGAGELDRVVPHAEDKLLAFGPDRGLYYYEHRPVTPSDRLFPEDLAVTLLINSRADKRATESVIENASSIDLSQLPAKSLERTTQDERGAVAGVIGRVAHWPGFAASLATKLLHKKRPDLIPILDNHAIFGAYMNPAWPERRSRGDSVKCAIRISQALNWIASDLTRGENRLAWSRLLELAPSRSLIEIFDMVWWIHFRAIEPSRMHL